jgi:glutathione S-transferase
MITLHESAISGNCYKVRLLLAQLGIPVRRVEFDIAALKAGQTHTEGFLAMNPEGRVPVAELEDGSFLPESNAILCYFAEGTRLLPADRLERAHVLRWLFWEQYSHEPYIAVVRAWRSYFGVPAGREAELPMREERGHAALDVLERTLARQPFLVGERYTIADIAVYAYTHVAGEGGFEMARYPKVGAWLARVAAEPGHVTITA